MENLEERFGMTEKQILDYAKNRDDLGEYEDEYLLDFIKGNQHGDLDDILDEFSHYGIEEDKTMENKEYAFNEIGELANYIEDAEFLEKEYILEKLAEIQSFIDNYL